MKRIFRNINTYYVQGVFSSSDYVVWTDKIIIEEWIETGAVWIVRGLI
jgi:hypothetical protein